jgi:hypothetical protein
MIDYEGIVKDMVDNGSVKSFTTIEYRKKWYSIEIKIDEEAGK